MYKKLFQFSLIVVCLEFLLRLFSINETFTESYKGSYEYFFSEFRQSWFHVWSPNSSLVFGQDEFKYTNYYNELGHRETSFKAFQQDTNALKIICLGDSFTEGDGAPYDSSWVRFFETKLQEEDSNLLVYNAGVCGSDVVYNGIILKEKLLDAKPSIVLECVNNSDLTDIYYRGGKERFNENGTHGFPNAKWWEPIYKYSYVFRAVICTFGPYDHNLINRRTLEEDERKSLNIMAAQITETYQLCKNLDISYYLIIMPIPSDANFRQKSVFQSLPEILPDYIPILDIYPPFYATYDSLNINEYSWLKNGHFNGKGYQLMGSHILEAFSNYEANK